MSVFLPRQPVAAPTYRYTTEEAVRGVYPDVGEYSVSSAIETAEMMIDLHIVEAGCGQHYSPSQLELIARYLAAHVFQVQHGVLSGKSTGQASENYTATLDKGIQSTLHGQQAMSFDLNGCLAKAQARQNAIIDGQLNAVPVIDIFPSTHTSFGRGYRRTC